MSKSLLLKTLSTQYSVPGTVPVACRAFHFLLCTGTIVAHLLLFVPVWRWLSHHNKNIMLTISHSRFVPKRAPNQNNDLSPTNGARSAGTLCGSTSRERTVQQGLPHRRSSCYVVRWTQLGLSRRRGTYYYQINSFSASSPRPTYANELA